jgi:hypothetical protein
VHGDHALEKTNRINMLFDFYGPLLTEKQRMFLKYHYLHDYSLGEIAADFAISRQAVYEHLKRAEEMLESYEKRLGLLKRHERIQDGLSRLEEQIARLPEEWRGELAETVRMLRGADLGAEADGDAAGSDDGGEAGFGPGGDLSPGRGEGAAEIDASAATGGKKAGRGARRAKKSGRADGHPEGGGEDGV